MKSKLSLVMTAGDNDLPPPAQVLAFFDDLSRDEIKQLDLQLLSNQAAADFVSQAKDYFSQRNINIDFVSTQEEGLGGLVHQSIRQAEGEWYMLLSCKDTLDAKNFSRFFNILSSQFLADSIGIIAYNVFEDDYADDKQSNTTEKLFPTTFEACDWADLKRFKISRLFTLDNSCFRSELLKKSPLRMPSGSHFSSYVYSYLPLPYVKQLYYADYDLRRSLICENKEILQARIGDFLRVTRMLYSIYHLESDVRDKAQREYMYTYLTAIVSTCALALLMRGNEEDYDRLERLWLWMRKQDPTMHKNVRSRLIYILMNMTGDRWKALQRQGIKFSQLFLSL